MIWLPYSIQFFVKENHIEVVRRNERIAGYFPKNEYNNVLNFFNEIYTADRGRIVLVKKEN